MQSPHSPSRWDRYGGGELRPPMPQEDFGPYLTQYGEYDAMLQDSMSSIQELDIPGYLNSDLSLQQAPPQQHHQQHPGFNQVTMTPATLAKYSRYMKGHPDAQKGSNGMGMAVSGMAANVSGVPSMMPPLTPEASPTKGFSPVTPGTGMGHMPYTPSSMHSSVPGSTHGSVSGGGASVAGSGQGPFKNYVNNVGPLQMVRLSAPYDEPEYFSPPDSRSPLGYDEPDMELDAETPTPSQDMMFGSDIDQSAIAWQPVLMAPRDEQSQMIIKSQQNMGKQSNRKSCLPPGKVDSYMAGPNMEGQFECLFPNCNKLFKRRYNVRSHIQTHLCDRPYSCEVCGARFVRPHDLRRHEKGHQDDRPFSCPCGKAFTRHDALQRHRMRMICSGGIEIEGRPKRLPAKRGRPRKKPLSTSSSESESDQSPFSSPEQAQEGFDPSQSYLVLQ